MKIFRAVLIILLVSTVVLVLIQVFSRYVVQKNVRGVEELARLTLVWGCFMGTAYAVLSKENITVDVLDFKSPRVTAGITLLTIAVMIFVGSVMVGPGILYVRKYWVFPDYSTATLMPRSLFYLPVPVCGLFVLGKNLSDLVAFIKRGKTGGSL